MKILVAIANHGTKNRGYLDQLLAAYRAMPWDVHLVVLSDKPKTDLGDDVEVLVGAPSKDPWSLPFAHRPLFRDRVDDYDLFLYSEDDTLLTETNLRAWMEVQAQLPPHQVAGFLRNEYYPDGKLSYCGVHYHYHWDVHRIGRVGAEVWAHYTNEHSALYVLNQAQLRHCLASGGYTIEPHQGRYDMLVSAASDPYTRCGLERVICVTRLPEFLLRHLPNIYIGRIGVHEDDFQPQLDRVEQIAKGELAPQELFDPVVRLDVPREAWNKDYYPRPEPLYREALQLDGASVLSVGMGAGFLEADWIEAGAQVTGIPVDAVIGAMAARRGVRVLEADLERAIAQVGSDRFDAIVLHHTLEHLPNPTRWLERLTTLLAPSGHLVLWVANQPGRKVRFRVRKEAYPLAAHASFEEAHYHETNPKVVRHWVREAGLRPDRIRYQLRDKAARVAPYALGLLDPYLADSFLLTARRP
ncbi:MAG: methyltransferase domain-containing protein [Planctomycetes bacterium]|nr:methyltransferase domain-containing protein [Planctomycetota bacterium]MCB9912183.1 methyltransferase domain-containing protein [Planctomycetota bacterium]HPF15843.1 methyltransferase domain-containing protein [Planctomycetota bacterium]